MRDLLRYETFERVVATLLLIGMGAVTLLATATFVMGVGRSALGIGDGLDYRSFQELFDLVLAAIIALELSHSLHQTARGIHGLVQVRTVVVIGVLAVVRKFMVIELETVSGLVLLGLGVAILALGTVYALTHWIEVLRPAARHRDDPGAPPV